MIFPSEFSNKRIIAGKSKNCPGIFQNLPIIDYDFRSEFSTKRMITQNSRKQH